MRPLAVLIQLPEFERECAMATGEFQQALDSVADDLMKPYHVVFHLRQGCPTCGITPSPIRGETRQRAYP